MVDDDEARYFIFNVNNANNTLQAYVWSMKCPIVYIYRPEVKSKTNYSSLEEYGKSYSWSMLCSEVQDQTVAVDRKMKNETTVIELEDLSNREQIESDYAYNADYGAWRCTLDEISFSKSDPGKSNCCCKNQELE